MPTNADFNRLLGKRMAVTVKQFKLIGNLARYPHNRSDAEGVIATLQAELDMLRAKYKIEAAAPVYQPPAPKVPEGAIRAVDGSDRQAIRSAMHRMHDGDVKGGAKEIRKVVLGWDL